MSKTVRTSIVILATGILAYLYLDARLAEQDARLSLRIAELRQDIANSSPGPSSSPSLHTSFNARVQSALQNGALIDALKRIQENRISRKSLEQALSPLRPMLPSTTNKAPVSKALNTHAVTPATVSGDHPAFYDAVQEVLMDLTDNVAFRTKLGLHLPPKEIPKNAPFEAVAKVLELDASQSSTMRDDLKELKTELFSALQVERDDGVNVMAEIAKAESLKDGDPGKTAVFAKLFQLRIPGTEKTYFERVSELQQSFHKKASDYLSREQIDRMNSTKIDWFSIDVN